MSEQQKIRLFSDPNRPSHKRMQEVVDGLISENLDTLNAMQAEAGLPPLADPRES